MTNCQTFAQEMFKRLGLDFEFKSYEGPVGEFMKYISKHSSQTYPCLVEKGKKIIEWKSHIELDIWHKENKDIYESNTFLKAFHRGFQVQDSEGENCIFDFPTLLIKDDGKKIFVKQGNLGNSSTDQSVQGKFGLFSSNIDN